MGSVRVTYVSERPEPHAYNKTLVDFMDSAEEITMNELREDQGEDDIIAEHVERPACQVLEQGPGQHGDGDIFERSMGVNRSGGWGRSVRRVFSLS